MKNKNKIICLFFLAAIINIGAGNTIYAEEANSLSPNNFELNSPIFEFEYKPSVYVDPMNGTATIYCSSIINHAMNGKSGDLELSVYLTQKKYEGDGTITGCEIVKKNIGRLNAGTQIKFNDGSIVLDVQYYPPAGTYYATVLLDEYSKDGFYIVKYQSIDKPVDIPANPVVKEKDQDLKTFIAVVGALTGSANTSPEPNEQTQPNTDNVDADNVDQKKVASLQRACDMLERHITKQKDDLARLIARHEQHLRNQRRDLDAGLIRFIDPDNGTAQLIIVTKLAIEKSEYQLLVYRQKINSHAI